MEENEKITKYLNAIYQNIRTAIQSIEDIIPKAESEALKSELSTEQDEYNCLAKECEAFAKAEKIERDKEYRRKKAEAKAKAEAEKEG